MNLYILSLFATAILFVGCIEAGEVYTSKYDNIDVDKILTNDRILSQYIKCLMDEGNCTNDGKELKSKYLFFFTSILVILFSFPEISVV